jgi:AraC-like DNA-binding protein
MREHATLYNEPASGPDDIAIGVARGILLTAANRGASIPELIAGTGLDPIALGTSHARISHQSIQDLVAESVRLTGDDDFGLHMAESLSGHIVLPAPLHYALASSPSVEAGARRLIAFARVLSRYASFELLIAQGRAHLCFRSHLYAPGRQLMECLWASVLLWLRSNCNHEFKLYEVSFTHAQPASISEHERIFRSAVHFGRSLDQLIFDSAVLGSRLLHSDPELALFLDERVERVCAPTGDPSRFVALVKHRVRESLRGVVPSMATVAAALNMSARTLQRQLTSAVISYRKIVDDVRRERAGYLLHHTSTASSEIAFMLGYSDVATFHRAVKRWYGTTPAAVRRLRHQHS